MPSDVPPLQPRRLLPAAAAALCVALPLGAAAWPDKSIEWVVPYAAGGGSTLIINPGEAGGWLHGKATAVILNPETMEYTLVEAPRYPQEGIS